MKLFTPVEAEVFADRMSPAQWDREVLRHIPLKSRLEEAELYLTKWWDYRPLHPAHATTLFAQAYGEAWRRAFVRRRGSEQDHWRLISTPFRTMDWNPFMEVQARARAFWKARRYCDEAGMPYDFYCYQFMDKAENYFEDLPRPQEMYRIDVIVPVLEDWELISGSGQYKMPNHPDYELRYNWQDKQHQHEWEAHYTAFLDRVPVHVKEWHIENNGKFIRQ